MIGYFVIECFSWRTFAVGLFQAYESSLKKEFEFHVCSEHILRMRDSVVANCKQKRTPLVRKLESRDARYVLGERLPY